MDISKKAVHHSFVMLWQEPDAVIGTKTAFYGRKKSAQRGKTEYYRVKRDFQSYGIWVELGQKHYCGAMS